MFKSKKIMSLLVAGALTINSFLAVFAADYSAIDSYKKKSLASETYSEETLSTNWQTSNSALETYNDEDVLAVSTTSQNNYIRRKHDNDAIVKTGIVTYQFDMIVPDSTKITKSMYIGVRQNGDPYGNVPLLYLRSTGAVSSGIDGNWDPKPCVTLSDWCTFIIQYDAETRIFKLYAGAKGGELSEIAGLANDYYATSSTKLDNGVTAFYIGTDNGAAANTNAYYIDNFSINLYDKAYTKINALTSADEVEAVISAYDKAGMLDISDAYYSIPDKTPINKRLIDATLTNDAEINTIITDMFAVGEAPVYVDLSDAYTADFIGKAGEEIELNEDGTWTSFGIGVNRKNWLNDIYYRDNYTGQGYDGAKISPYMTADGVLTATNNCEESRSFKVPVSALSAGIMDAVVINSSQTKDEDTGLMLPGKSLDVALSGKKLSEICVAAMGGVPNLTYLGAEINYADGTKEDVFLGESYIPSSGIVNSKLYQTADFGYMIYPDETGVLVDDTRTVMTGSSTTDNRKSSRMTVVEFPTDESKNINSVRLYVKSKYGSSSVAVFGVTEVPAKTGALLDNVVAADGITIETAIDNAQTVIKAYNSMYELIERGFYSENDETITNITALYNVLDSEGAGCSVDVKAELKNESGDTVDKMSEAVTVDVVACCDNQTLEAKSAVLIAAFYNGEGRALTIKSSEKVTAPAYGKGEPSIEGLEIPEDAATMKLFVWSDLDDIKPVCEQKVIVK